MLLVVQHRTEYRYDGPVRSGLARLRLWPREGAHQRVARWHVSIDGAVEQARFEDAHGNAVALVGVVPGAERMVVAVDGEVDTLCEDGILGDAPGAPLWLYRRATELTAGGEGVRHVLAGFDASDALASLHSLSARIRGRVAYVAGTTGPATTAEQSLSLGAGVCQDHAHVFVAACRVAGVPARYVSGYLRMNDRDDQDATHAWAEAWIDGLGWTGFDVSNGYSPDGRYVRLAVGLDYRDAAPVSGIVDAERTETLDVSISVIQRQQQQ